MAHTRKTEQRLLSTSEREIVDKARHPELAALSDADLHDLVHHLRDRRDRALTIANNQRRALRGKGGRGEVTFEKADGGNRQKASVLTDALTRARREATRRRTQAARDQLVGNAQRALMMKRAAGTPHHPDAGRHASEGMTDKSRTKTERLGSSSGEVGRVTKAVAVAQARKDAR